jgi:hypothetical protein
VAKGAVAGMAVASASTGKAVSPRVAVPKLQIPVPSVTALNKIFSTNGPVRPPNRGAVVSGFLKST